MTRHLAAGTVAVCTGKPPNARLAELTARIDLVTCQRCKSALRRTMQRMGKKEPLAALIGATKPEPRGPNRQRSQPRRGGKVAR